MPDGTIIRNVPEGTTQSQLLARYKKAQNPQIAQSNEKSALGAAIIGAGRGASFGLSDRLHATIEGGAKNLANTAGNMLNLDYATDQDFGDFYSEALAKNQQGAQEYRDANPAAFIGGELAGALGTGVAGGITKTGQAIGGSIGRGLLPNAAGGIGKAANATTKAAQAAGVGAASSAVYGGATAPEGEVVDNARDAAVYGAAFGAASPAVANLLNKTFQSTSDAVRSVGRDLYILSKRGDLKGIKPTSDAMQGLARRAYKAAADAGGELTESFNKKFIKAADDIMPQTQAGKLLAGDDAVSQITSRVKDNLSGRRFSLAEAQEIDEFLGDAIDGFVQPTGKLNKQGKKLLDLQTSFRNLIDDVSPDDLAGGKQGFEAWKEGRKLWSATSKLRDIEKIITRAELMDQPATGIKSGFRTLLSNPKRLRGFTDAEQKLIRKAAETGAVSDAIRVMGSRLIPIVTLGSGAGPGAFLGAQVGSTLSRKGGEALQMRRAGKIAKEIMQNALINTPQTTQMNMPAALMSGAVPARISNAPRQSVPVSSENFRQLQTQE